MVLGFCESQPGRGPAGELEPPEEGRAVRAVQLRALGAMPRRGKAGLRPPQPAETLKEPREMWIDRYNPKLHYLVLWLSFVSVQ